MSARKRRRHTKGLITGTFAIAKQLGVSSSTVRRMIQGNEIRAFKFRDNTSPFRVKKSELRRVRKRMRKS